MAIHKLKAKEIDALPYGNWPDGGNLYVCVNKDGSSRSWGLRITKFGLDTFMMLGPTYTYSLAEARGWATKQRQLMKEGVNPLQARRDAAHEAKRAVDRNTPFAEVAKQWLAVMAASDAWQGKTSYSNAVAALKNHVYPHIGPVPIWRFDTSLPGNKAVALVHEVLEPIWYDIKTQARHVRFYMKSVLEYAASVDYIVACNAIVMKPGSKLWALLPGRKHQPKHHASLPYPQVSNLVAKIRGHWIVPPNGALKCALCKHPKRAEIEAKYQAYLLDPPRMGPAPRSTLSDTQRAEAIKRRAAGETLTAIATSFGVPETTMWRILQRPLRQPKLSDDQRADIIQRRDSGETLASIAASHGVHLGTIHRVYKERLSRPEPVRDTLRDIAEQYGLHRSGIKAHFAKHLSPDGLKKYRPVSTYALEFLILTVPRKMEGAEIKWDDIDWDAKLWVKDKHKARTAGKTDQAHTVILSDAAMSILHDMDKLRKEEGTTSEYVFPGQKPGRPPGQTTLNQIMTRNWPEFRDQDGRKITIHGFRRTFGNWSVDNSFGKIWGEIDSEMALAHKLGDDTRNAYKGDAKRLVPGRAMMEEWASRCGGHDGHGADVVPFPQRAKA